jgi:spore coat protein A, manganese oxidase
MAELATVTHNHKTLSRGTLAIDDGEEVDVIIRWNAYRGRYLLQGNYLEHEDHSMMARVDVV